MRILHVAAAFAGLAIGLTTAQASLAATFVSARAGAVAGVTEDGLTVFKGIPYAKAPVGDLRWRAP